MLHHEFIEAPSLNKPWQRAWMLLMFGNRFNQLLLKKIKTVSSVTFVNKAIK
jgi:hypothetical protein